MDAYILISVLSVMYYWILCTVRAADLPATEIPTASTVTQGRHVRAKRCSCATFLDKECVYFCHLDIIWVNTPERVVSYGLGNAPRSKRAVASSMATSGGPRCQCFRENDNTCRNFCCLEKTLRYETLPEKVTCSAEGDAGKSKRMTNSNKKQVSPLAIRSASRTHMLLEKWRARQHHRARAWPPKDKRLPPHLVIHRKGRGSITPL